MLRESYQEEPLYSSISLVSYSAYEVKNNCFLFEWFLKIKRMGFSILDYIFFVLEIMTFSYYANEESDDVICVIGRTTLLAPANQRSTFLFQF